MTVYHGVYEKMLEIFQRRSEYRNKISSDRIVRTTTKKNRETVEIMHNICTTMLL